MRERRQKFIFRAARNFRILTGGTFSRQQSRDLFLGAFLFGDVTRDL